MAEPNKQQIGEGQDNYGQAAYQAGRAAQQASKAAARGVEATANAAAASVQAGVETGKATAQIAAGTAAGGPWGAILSAAWALRHTLFKILICICLSGLFLVVMVVSLPSLIFNEDTAGNMHEAADDMADVVAACIQEGYDLALVEVERIIEQNGYDYETSMEALINYGSLSPEYDVAYVFAAYSASMGQQGTSAEDMRSKLLAVADSMFQVTYEERTFERTIPLTYSTYEPVAVTVITDKTKIGEVGGEARYRYSTAVKTYYSPAGEAVTETEIEVPSYTEVTVEVPVYNRGSITGTQRATYYTRGNNATLTPEIETVRYAEATIHPFNESIIWRAFDIDPNAEYGEFPGTTYGDAVKTMADALKLTLYGTLAEGDIPPLTDAEMQEYVGNIEGSDARKKLVETALSLVGKVPYFWGGKSEAGWNDEWNTPKVVKSSGSVTTGSLRPYGLDCSGFTDWAYKTALGQSIGTGSSSQWSKSYEINEAELLPGDLGFKASPSEPGTNHVLMYVGLNEAGEKLWVHCSSSKGGVVVDSPSYVRHFRRPSSIDFSASLGNTDGLGEPLYTLKVQVTHYCACSKCCGDSADGITASGRQVAEGMVAMSSYYPFGTQLMINGVLYTVEDRGGSKIENDKSRVDIFVDDHQEALRLGRYWAEAEFYRIGR